MESPVAAAKPPLGWKEPAASPLHKPLLSVSPNTNGASSSSTSGSSNGNHNRNNNHGGAGGGLPAHPAVKTIPRSDANPYPTTFVQADTNSFKQVVQMLTGSSETAAKHAATASSPRPATTTTAGGASAGSASDLASPRPHPPPLHPHHPPPPPSPIPPTSLKPSTIPTGPKRPAFKLYERRHNSFKNLRINPLVPGLFNGVLVSQASSASSTPNSPSLSRTHTPATTTGFSPRYKPEILSPSILDFPSLALSPVTPLSPDPFNRPPATSASSTPQSYSAAEDRAIAEKGFYLHPSPRSSLGAEPPRLLPLFPVTSPRVAAAAGAASASSGATDSSA